MPSGLSSKCGGVIVGPVFTRWHAWAVAQADRIDPVASGAFSRLEGLKDDRDGSNAEIAPKSHRNLWADQ